MATGRCGRRIGDLGADEEFMRAVSDPGDTDAGMNCRANDAGIAPRRVGIRAIASKIA